MLNPIDIKNLAQLKLKHLNMISSEECIANLDYGRFKNSGPRKKGNYIKTLIQILHALEVENPEAFKVQFNPTKENKDEKTNS